ncbi:hypothetical protein D0Z07_9273 [Hyphodiscus hymeniophilus]|uniref:C2H2-type domain-containing protein n=1 Tax=Hyphodiscus hymeniophilus TaxID=353542 RepID=A0A9P6SPE6_9HELO|nr:hypothetical protein D0Z07_9273 [Hyphodiscus hymeniophilus]
MAYNMPFGQTMHSQQPFFVDNCNMSNQPIFHQENLMEIDNSWMENVDPLLHRNLPWQHQQQQQPLQRFVNEPQRAFFTAGPLPSPARPRSFPRVNRPSEAIPSLPQATQARMVSPSPSGASQEPNSQCSSARSPAPEFDWFGENFYPQQQDEHSFPSVSYLTQGLPGLWNDRSRGSSIPQVSGNTYVHLNQVQGFPDPQEVAFEADEGYMDMDMKNEYTIEVDHRIMKIEATHHHQTSYRHSSDEGLGASIKDANSPQETGTGHVDIDATTDLDADADAEGDEDVIIAEPASDTEYSPKSTRTRKRRASKVSSPAAKRSRVLNGRVTKPAQNKDSLVCKQCNHAPFKDAATLQRHVNSTHTRAFICVFGFAGCSSTFASKNEWKRHVSSQHLSLSSWVCELGTCGKVQNQPKRDGGGFVKGSEFNRKDLFTQHLRRMHAPFAVKRQNKKNQEWEERLKELQVSCLRVKRQPPLRLACPLNDCGTVFEGATCWDDRMEHVGKHLEKAAASTGGSKFTVEQGDDEMLVSWGLRERIIERKAGGGYKLCGPWLEKVEDEDAEGEYE